MSEASIALSSTPRHPHPAPASVSQAVCLPRLPRLQLDPAVWETTNGGRPGTLEARIVLGDLALRLEACPALDTDGLIDVQRATIRGRQYLVAAYAA